MDVVSSWAARRNIKTRNDLEGSVRGLIEQSIQNKLSVYIPEARK
jgi:hypothetical protein